jgi:hypothetical protein
MASKDLNTTAMDITTAADVEADIELLGLKTRAHSAGAKSSIRIRDDEELERVGKVPTLKVCPQYSLENILVRIVIIPKYLFIFDHSGDLDSCPF